MNHLNFQSNIISVNQRIYFEDFGSDFEMYIKREDLLHPFVSGNKLRKLKYNILEAKQNGFETILTYGGAFSNHIAALSYAANSLGFNSIGVIRGDELKGKVADNPTLTFAQEQQMQFEFTTREQYRAKYDSNYQSYLKKKFGRFYNLPEGGSNELAIRGCEEILTEEDVYFDYIVVAVGTGGTMTGLINATARHQKVLGVAILKGDFLKSDIQKKTFKTNWELITDYHFGGYAKINDVLIAFINRFYQQAQIPLDPIYTGKMCFGVAQLIKNGFFRKKSKILMIHTGGLQGIRGINQKLGKQKKTLIDV